MYYMLPKSMVASLPCSSKIDNWILVLADYVQVSCCPSLRMVGTFKVFSSDLVGGRIKVSSDSYQVLTYVKKVKVAHTRLPSIWFQS